tara:strand:+ start:453 stop:611 length:159 start_codon:yes stop_codon:yes gene_type:complete
MKRVMVVLELEGGEAVVVHSKELMQHAEDIQRELNLDDDEEDDLDLKGKFCI